MIVMGNPDNLSCDQLLKLYISQYLEAHKDCEQASDNLFHIDDHDFERLLPEEVVSLREIYERSYQDLQSKASALAFLVASLKDRIHID